jgi:hypothetical protein
MNVDDIKPFLKDAGALGILIVCLLKWGIPAVAKAIAIAFGTLTDAVKETTAATKEGTKVLGELRSEVAALRVEVGYIKGRLDAPPGATTDPPHLHVVPAGTADHAPVSTGTTGGGP